MVNNICSLKIVLFFFFVTSCEQDKKILFDNKNYEVTNLDGNWELVKTGIFEDLSCKVIDKKLKKSHSDMGMRGKIIIE